MSEAIPRRSSRKHDALAGAAASWLCLAAAPAFALMAVLSGVLGNGMSDMSCSTVGGASALGGMVPMYLLMSVFHLGPWLKLIAVRESGVRRP
jgi:hypothetical protein